MKKDRSVREQRAAAILSAASDRRDRWITSASDRSQQSADPPSGAAGFLFHDDQQWPSRLRDMQDMPAMLSYRGRSSIFDMENSVAIVGARNAPSPALDAARLLGRELAAEGVAVVSGLAAGVDTHAHQGALDANGGTVAAVGTGIDVCFPESNDALKSKIESVGLVVSQFPYGQRGSKTSFVTRNSIIAALSDASLTVYAEERSGTRTELNAALSIGRPVLFWEPTMSGMRWARDLADEKPDVRFVSTVSDIIRFACVGWVTANLFSE